VKNQTHGDVIKFEFFSEEEKYCRLFKPEKRAEIALIIRTIELEGSSIDCLVQPRCSQQAARPVSTCNLSIFTDGDSAASPVFDHTHSEELFLMPKWSCIVKTRPISTC